MIETTKTLATKQKTELYTKLVDDFMNNEKLKVSPEEKAKFLNLCVLYELNPWKKEIYPIPRKTKQGEQRITVLTTVIDYKVFVARAELSGRLDGWNVTMRRDAEGKITGGKIMIYRNDRHNPFEYEAEVKDLVSYRTDKDGKKVLENSLRETKTEAMLRKQLIRIGFPLAFPGVTPVSDPEDITEDQMYHGIKKEATIIEGETVKPLEFIDYLLSFLPDGYVAEGYEGGPSEDQYDDYVKALQVEIGRRCIKDKTIILEKEEIKNIFIGEDKAVVAMKKEALASLKDEERDD